MTLALSAQLTLLALIDSTSIGTLLIPLWLLMRRDAKRLIPRIALYLGLLAGFYWLVGILLLSGVGWISQMFSGQSLLVLPAVPWIMTISGGLLLAYALISDPKKAKAVVPAGAPAGADPGLISAGATERRWHTRITRALSSPGGVVVLALLAGLLELPTMVPYLAAVGFLSQSTLEFPAALVVLSLYCLVMLLPALLLVGLRLSLGVKGEGLLQRVGAKLSRYSTEALLWGAGIVGFLLLRGGLVALGPDIAWNPFG